MYTIISSANTDTLTLSFSVYIHFISFCCLIALAKTSSTMILVGLLLVSLHLIWCWLLVCCILLLLCLVIGLEFLIFSRFLIWRAIVFYWRFFQHLMRWSCDFFLVFIYVVYYLNGFPYIWTIPESLGWSLFDYGDDHFDVFLNLFCENFIEYFCINFISEIGL